MPSFVSCAVRAFPLAFIECPFPCYAYALCVVQVGDGQCLAMLLAHRNPAPDVHWKDAYEKTAVDYVREQAASNRDMVEAGFLYESQVSVLSPQQPLLLHRWCIRRLWLPSAP